MLVVQAHRQDHRLHLGEGGGEKLLQHSAKVVCGGSGVTVNLYVRMDEGGDPVEV